MTRFSTTALLMSLCTAILSAGAAPPQLGGLIKSKVKQTVDPKKDEKKSESDKAVNPLASADVVLMTPVVLDGLKKGLTFEVSERAAFRKMLASLKTREQYAECSQETALTDEGQKIAMQFADIPENATPAQMQKAMMKMADDMKVLTTKRCGTDPGEWPESRRADRLREIQGQASNLAMPPGWVAPKSPLADEPLNPRDFEAHGPSAGLDGTIEGTSTAQGAQYPYGRPYMMLIERFPPFCGDLAKKGNKGKPDPAGVKIPGIGSVYYVYTADEAAALMTTCEDLMALLGKLN